MAHSLLQPDRTASDISRTVFDCAERCHTRFDPCLETRFSVLYMLGKIKLKVQRFSRISRAFQRAGPVIQIQPAPMSGIRGRWE